MYIDKTLFYLVLVLFAVVLGCNEKSPNSIELITNSGRQDSIFQKIMAIAGNSMQTNDSMAFLILPVEASCPSCRKKTIDSIIKHQNDLPSNHFIIITAGAGRKTMSSYFREQKATMPNIPQVILDTVNQAKKLELFENNPAIYYAVNRKVYKKVLAWPATVRQDLQEFFSGNRANTDIVKED